MPRIANVGETIKFRDSNNRLHEGKIVALNSVSVRVQTAPFQLEGRSPKTKSSWLVSRSYADKYVRGQIKDAEAQPR